MPIEKPLIARLQETDVLRTLTGILAGPAVSDVTRMGWPTLRTNCAAVARSSPRSTSCV